LLARLLLAHLLLAHLLLAAAACKHPSIRPRCAIAGHGLLLLHLLLGLRAHLLPELLLLLLLLLALRAHLFAAAASSTKAPGWACSCRARGEEGQVKHIILVHVPRR
jgi:hypothetical protein